MSSSESENSLDNDSKVRLSIGNKRLRTIESMKVRMTKSEEWYRKRNEVNVLTDGRPELQCTHCSKDLSGLVIEGRTVDYHPLLMVLLCDTCRGFYTNGEFSMDEDGTDKYCRWCGQGGLIYLCNRCICGFCPACIKNNFGLKTLQEIDEDEDWLCFICQPRPLWPLRNICALALSTSVSQRNKFRKKRERNLLRLKRFRNKKMKHLFSNSEPSSSSESEVEMRKRKWVLASDSGEEEMQVHGKTQGQDNSLESGETLEKESKNFFSAHRDSSEESKDSLQKRRHRFPGCKDILNGHRDSSQETKDSLQKRLLELQPKEEAVSDACSAETVIYDGFIESPVPSPALSLKMTEKASPTMDEDDGTKMKTKHKFADVEKAALDDLTCVLGVVEITSELCRYFCTRELKKLCRPDGVLTRPQLQKKYTKIETAVALLKNHLDAISSTVEVLRS